MELAALRRELQKLDSSVTVDAAQDCLAEIGRQIGLPVLAWAPDVCSPEYNSDMDAFYRRAGWAPDVLRVWWDRSAMLKNPLYIQCRTHGVPFVFGPIASPTNGRAETRLITADMYRLGAHTLITVPVYLPRGQVSMVSWGGAMTTKEAGRVLAKFKPELIAAGQLFSHVYIASRVRCLPSAEEHSAFTIRERECLRFTAQGCREDEVAALIGLSSTTVRYHLDNVVRKLGASNRAHAVGLAAQLGVLGPIS